MQEIYTTSKTDTTTQTKKAWIEEIESEGFHVGYNDHNEKNLTATEYFDLNLAEGYFIDVTDYYHDSIRDDVDQDIEDNNFSMGQ